MPFVINSNFVSDFLPKSTAKKLNPLKKVPRFKISTAERVLPASRNHKINDLHLTTIDPRKKFCLRAQKANSFCACIILGSNASGFLLGREGVTQIRDIFVAGTFFQGEDLQIYVKNHINLFPSYIIV